jgi:hypothetical protein
MTDFPIELHVAELRPAEFTLKRVSEALVANMSGTVKEILMDASVDIAPVESTGAAPKFTGGTWYSWEQSLHIYTPVDTRVGDVLITANPTINRIQILQNKDGVVALHDDVYWISPTVLLTEGLVTIDWNKGTNFLCVLSGNRKSAFYMAHAKEGMEIDVLLVNNGINQLVETWDPAVLWPGGAQPVMPAALPGTSARQKITLRNVNNIIYGEYVNYAAGAPLSYDASEPFHIS